MNNNFVSLMKMDIDHLLCAAQRNKYNFMKQETSLQIPTPSQDLLSFEDKFY